MRMGKELSISAIFELIDGSGVPRLTFWQGGGLWNQNTLFFSQPSELDCWSKITLKMDTNEKPQQKL